MKYVLIGKIVNTHGLKGEVRILSDFKYKDRVFKIGMKIYIGKNKVCEEINSYRYHKIFDMITIDDYDNINDVLKFVGKNVYVSRISLNLKKSEYLLSDLIGLNVVSNDTVYGIVRDYSNDINPLLKVDYDKNYYIPINSNYIKSVDLDKKEIVVDDIEGLII